MCEDAKKEMEQLIREVRNMLEEDADIKRLFAKNKNTGLQVEIAGVGKVSLEEAEKLVGKDVRWSKGGSGCREKKINNPRNVERQAKKLSPEARKGYEKAIEALRSGDTRGLNDHSLSGNRHGQRAIDIKGTGKGRGAGRIIYEYGDADENRSTYPCGGALKFGVHCFECSKFSYTFCPNEIAVSDSEGIVEEWIGFGGEMEPNEQEKKDEYVTEWNKICKQKINEAYDNFISYREDGTDRC